MLAVIGSLTPRKGRNIIRAPYLFNNSIRIARVFPKSQIEPVMRINRRTLEKVDNWIEDDVYEKSIFQYGLPRSARHLIDKEIGADITYTDAMLYLSRYLKKKINYLELGVSVGKNFIQIVDYFHHSASTGVDIEEINPVLEGFFKKVSYMGWKTGINSMKRGASSLSEYYYTPNHNQITYISGDIFDESTWRALSARKFNMVFSDAFHSPEALLHEYEMIKKYELLDPDEFIFIWDDLGREMTTSFMQIWHDLRFKHNLRNSSRLMVRLRGWLGINEDKHPVGIIMRFDD